MDFLVELQQFFRFVLGSHVSYSGVHFTTHGFSAAILSASSIWGVHQAHDVQFHSHDLVEFLPILDSGLLLLQQRVPPIPPLLLVLMLNID